MSTDLRPGATPLRILLVGGSIANGLGVRENPFGKRIGAHADVRPELLDMTGSGRMIDDVLPEHRDAVVDFAPQVAVICAGMSERLVHAPARFQALLNRYAPATWHGVAGLQPRAYFSENAARRRRQQAVSRLKTAVKRTVLRFGSHQRMSLAGFEQELLTMLTLLDGLGCRVVLVGTGQVDDTLFPGTEQTYLELSAKLRETAAAHPHVTFLDPRAILDCWSDYVDDRFHWNEQGHDKIARAIEDVLVDWDVPTEHLVAR